jgi:hypothetical protein
MPIRDGDATTLEIWVDAEDRGGDADRAILRVAADLDALHPATGQGSSPVTSACSCAPR